MSNPIEKLERGHARVCGIRKDRGWLSIHLTTLSHGRAFFALHSWRRKAGIMVALLVDSLGKVRPTCFARAMLFAAADSAEAGDIVKAGIELREAANRFLAALCEAHGCVPEKKYDRCPGGMLVVLLKRKHIDRHTYRWLREIVEVGNKCAHCRKVDASLVKTGIGMLHLILDDAPEIKEAGLRGEQAKWGWQCDDDDDGEGWKAVVQ